MTQEAAVFDNHTVTQSKHTKEPGDDSSLLLAQNDNTEHEMNAKMEGYLAIGTALLVLFSAMLDPRIAMMISVGVLSTFGVYQFLCREN